MGVSAVLLVCTFLPGGILYLERNSSPSTRKEEWSAGRGCGGGWSRMVELGSARNKGCGEGGGEWWHRHWKGERVAAGGARERGRMKSDWDVQGSTSCIGSLL